MKRTPLPRFDGQGDTRESRSTTIRCGGFRSKSTCLTARPLLSILELDSGLEKDEAPPESRGKFIHEARASGGAPHPHSQQRHLVPGQSGCQQRRAASGRLHPENRNASARNCGDGRTGRHSVTLHVFVDSRRRFHMGVIASSAPSVLSLLGAGPRSARRAIKRPSSLDRVAVHA